ncbi:DUF2806 domain-containing protein [Dyella sp. 2HG41-7]|uniref:DUF2806 domain-containing protein n=1 Tax=Dyella sp. 2HG41-7 TaxID=2883239 RepID=UPI001F37AEA1|nr:DUF2806 domain-containing protein [Dyella sp. 2HG41-7]
MADEKNGLIVIDGKHFGKAAQVLIEKVSQGIGGLYRPTQIRRIAKAEAEAGLIAAQNKLEIDELQMRAAQRWLAEESRKQENIESITDKAIPLLHEQSDASNVEDDWIANFFEKTKIVSDGEMQKLWAKVLAGEANNPGTYSRRTVNIIADLEKSDAQLFSRLCGFIWNVAGRVPLIFDTQADIYHQHGISFDTLSHLETLGLITFNEMTGYSKIRLGGQFPIVYFGKPILITPSAGTLDIGKVLLTNAGHQLASVANASPVDGFFEYVVQRYSSTAGVSVGPANLVTVKVPQA